MNFPAGDRTYHVSDQRMKAFLALTVEQRMRWVEELATFLRLAKVSREQPVAGSDTKPS